MYSHKLFLSVILALTLCTVAVGQLRQQELPPSLIAQNLDVKYGEFLVAIVSDANASKELEIVESQKKDLRKVVNKANEALSKTLKDNRVLLESGQEEEYQTKNREAFIECQLQIDEGFAEVLLPHQVAEVKRFARWMTIEKVGGLFVYLNTSQAKKSLDIDKEQIGKIGGKYKTLTDEFQEDLQKLQAKYRARLIDELEEKQQRKIKTMLGEPMVFGKLRIAF